MTAMGKGKIDPCPPFTSRGKVAGQVTVLTCHTLYQYSSSPFSICIPRTSNTQPTKNLLSLSLSAPLQGTRSRHAGHFTCR